MTFRSFLLLLLAFAACRPSKLKENGCNQDSDCGQNASAYRCEVQTGVCYCRTNEACAPREFCNTAGFCQDRSGCEKNSDCTGDSLFCDTTAGTCLSKGRCTSDLHCELDQVCDFKKSSCVDGCRSNGDCSAASCRCGEGPCTCSGTSTEDLSKCTIGECDPNFCSDADACKFGELCGVPEDAGVSRNTCYSDFDDDRRPYCANCGGGGGTATCGNGGNYCLIDSAHPGNVFCGADCSQGQLCPRGYGCEDVIVIRQEEICNPSNAACPINPSLPCILDSDCKRGGFCAKQGGSTTGFCAGKCFVGEGQSLGYCSCQVDADCAQDSCSMGECSISRRKCVNQTDCYPIHCVDFEGGGGCLIGQNCAPTNGLSCLEVQ